MAGGEKRGTSVANFNLARAQKAFCENIKKASLNIWAIYSAVESNFFRPLYLLRSLLSILNIKESFLWHQKIV